MSKKNLNELVEPIISDEEFIERRKLFFKSWELAGKEYQQRNFIKPLSVDHPCYYLQFHRAIRTGRRSYNEMRNTEEKIKLAKKIYRRLILEYEINKCA